MQPVIKNKNEIENTQNAQRQLVSNSGDVICRLYSYLTCMNSRICFRYDQDIFIIINILLNLNAIFCGQFFAINEPKFNKLVYL